MKILRIPDEDRLPDDSDTQWLTDNTLQTLVTQGNDFDRVLLEITDIMRAFLITGKKLVQELTALFPGIEWELHAIPCADISEDN